MSGLYSEIMSVKSRAENVFAHSNSCASASSEMNLERKMRWISSFSFDDEDARTLEQRCACFVAKFVRGNIREGPRGKTKRRESVRVMTLYEKISNCFSFWYKKKRAY